MAAPPRPSEPDRGDRAARVLEERNAAFRVLYDTVVEIESARDEQTHAVICRNLRRLCNARAAALATYCPRANELTLRAVDFEEGLAELGQRLAPHEPRPVPTGVSARFCEAQVRECVNCDNCPVRFVRWRDEDVPAELCAAPAYCLSCLRGGELIAVAKVYLSAGERLRTKDIIDTYLGLAAMVLQRMQAVNAVRDSELLLRTIIEAASDAVVAIAPDDAVTLYNPAAERLFGAAADEAVGQSFDRLLPAARRDECVARVRACFAGGAAAGRVEIDGVRGDGGELVAEASLSANRHGGRPCVVMVVRDERERRRVERERERANQQLRDVSREAGIATVATSILHSVGNALNSINVSAALVAEQVHNSRVCFVAKLADLMSAHRDDLARFVTADERGRRVPEYLVQLGAALAGEQESLTQELQSLRENVDYVKRIVAAQHACTGVRGVVERVAVRDLIEPALAMHDATLEFHGIEIVRDYDDLPPIETERHKAVQILLNLVSNARDALLAAKPPQPVLRVSARPAEHGVTIVVQDNGVGIASDLMPRLFQHGFSTKPDGHGFGLHGSALTAKELGGRLIGASDGPGRGARFELQLPRQAPAADARTDSSGGSA